MSGFNVIIPKDTIKINGNSLEFEFKGDPKYGLDKTIVNGIRRVLLSSLKSVAFRTEGENPDLVMVKNNSSLHNEYLLHRFSLIPLYLNPLGWNKNLLFKLNVKNDTNEIRSITAEDIDVYNLKQSIKDSDEKLEGVNVENYDLNKKVSDKDKERIFRPFKIEGLTQYCLFTELSSKQSDKNTPEIELYGSPSVSCAYEDVRWQPVSCAVYSFKEDEKLFIKVAKEKIKVHNILPEHEKDFVNELHVNESERYYHRDSNLQPYWYNFKIDSQGYYPPYTTDKGPGLLVQSCDILMEMFNDLKDNFKKVLQGDDESNISIKKTDNELIYKIIIHGGDDTVGSILQSHICNKLIDDESILSLCGYKKLHPLEEIITFTISLNTNNNIVKLDNVQQMNAIVEQMMIGCDEINLIYQKIKEESEKI